MRFAPADERFVEQIAHVCVLLDDRRIRWFDHEYLIAEPEDDESLSTRTIKTLADVFYAHLYCRGKLEAEPLADVALSGTATSSFSDDVLAENRLAPAWEGGWSLDGEQDGVTVLRRAGITVVAEPNDVRALDRNADDDDTGGSVEMLLRRPTTDLHASPGFLFFDNGALPPMATDQMIRFYWHLTLEAAPVFMRAVTTEFGDVPFQAKLLQSPGSYQRCDAGVLYLDLATLDINRVVAVHQQLVDLLRPTRPAFTLELAHGLGAAAEPITHESFGQFACRALAVGLVSLGPGSHAPAELVAAMMTAVQDTEPALGSVHGLADNVVAELTSAPWVTKTRLEASGIQLADLDNLTSSVLKTCAARLEQGALAVDGHMRWVKPATDGLIVELTSDGLSNGHTGIATFLAAVGQDQHRVELTHLACKVLTSASAAASASTDSSHGLDGAAGVALGQRAVAGRWLTRPNIAQPSTNRTRLGLGDGLAGDLLIAALAAKAGTIGAVDRCQILSEALGRRATRATHRHLGAGLWSGRSGIALALAHAWRQTNDDRTLAAIQTLVRGLERERQRDGRFVSHRHDPIGMRLPGGIAPDLVGFGDGPAGIAVALAQINQILPEGFVTGTGVNSDIGQLIDAATRQAVEELEMRVSDPTPPIDLLSGLAGLVLAVHALANAGIAAAADTGTLRLRAWQHIASEIDAGALNEDPTWAHGLAGVGATAHAVSGDFSEPLRSLLAGLRA